MKKKGFAITIVLLSAMLAGCRKVTLDEKIYREAKEYTAKNCPRISEQDIMMDSLCYDMDSRTLSYCYTISGVIDKEEIYDEQLCGAFREKVLGELRNNIQLKDYKDANIRFRYIYHSESTGEVLIELTFGKEDYS